MATKFSEYSALRSIARKRAERLSGAGLANLVTFPTVKELKVQGVSVENALRNIQRFLESPTKTREYRKLDEQQRPVIQQVGQQVVVSAKEQAKAEKRRAQNRESARRYRERVRNLTKQQRSYMKAAKTLGLHITPANAKAFAEYMDYRFAQGSDSVHYRIARFVEDYISIIARKGYKPGEILNDFNLFLSDRSALMESAGNMNGITPEQMDQLFEEFAEEDYWGEYD